MVASVLLISALGLLLVTNLRFGMQLATAERRVLSTLFTASALGLTLLLYPSNPKDWSLANSVLFLSRPRLDLIHVLGNLALGGLLFSLATLAVYWANRR